MSTDTEQVDVRSSRSVVDLAQRWYHVPALAVLMLYMLWVRFQSYDSVVRDGAVYFIGNDAYYHYRETMFAVENWPRTMQFDPWTRFPFGTSADQFGTLFDQLIATAILIVGLGNPGDRQAQIVFAIAPAVFGVLCAIPTYYIGKRVSDRLGGLFAVLVLALLPGMFLLRSVVGFTDHHVGEVLFQSLAVLAMMVALTVAEREKPVYEQFQDGDWEGLRATIKWSAIAGLALAAYLWTWPPGAILIGIFGVFFVVAVCVEYLHGRSPEHIAIVGTISLAVAAVLSLVAIDEVGITGPTTMSLIQPLLALSVAAGCVFLAWLARLWDREDRDAERFPVAVAAIGAVAVVVAYVVVPDVVSMVWSQIQRSLLLGQSSQALTIQEAQTTLSQQGGLMGYMFRSYGFTYVVALIGFGWLVGHLVDAERYRSEYTLIAVWAVFVMMMAISQVRFHYYLAVVVAVLNAVAIGAATSVLGVPSFDRLEDVETYQVLAIAVIVVLVIFPLAPNIALASGSAVDQANARGPGTVTTWDDSLEWMGANTAEPGTYGGAQEEFGYYERHGRTGDFDYPDGTYGVLSWWDYGHWITVEGERPAVANPFQQNARTASAFFQAQSERRANAVIDALPAESQTDGILGNKETEELESIAANRTDQQRGEQTRYVMIDDQMAGEKYGAITQWTSPPDVAGQPNVGTEEFYNTTLARLYFSDAAGMSNYRLVHENERFSVVGALQSGDRTVWASNHAVATGWDEAAPYHQQLASYRNTHVASSVKTYERVEGATLTGEAEPTQTVVVTVELESNAGRPFVYAQETRTGEDGTFEVTVPYATNDELGPEDGYTDSAVNATSDYHVVAGDNVSQSDYRGDGQWASGAEISAEGTTTVPEPTIYGGETVQVDLGEYESADNSSEGDSEQ